MGRPTPSPTASTPDTWREEVHRLLFDIGALATRRKIFKTLFKILRRRRGLREAAGDLTEAMGTAHAVDMGISIRRHYQHDPDDQSLHRLLIELRRGNRHLTADRYVAEARRPIPGDPPREFTPEHEHDVRGEFRRLFATAGEPDVASVRRLQRDISLLDRTCRPIAEYATRRIAHTLKTQPPMVYWRQVDRAIEVLKKLVRRYVMLLHCASCADDFFEPSRGWEEALRFPWSAAPRARRDRIAAGQVTPRSQRE
ncbi:MAG: hypothetical protein L0216_11970 [Planctomycetales bacterium]|nr:hypothetical protein [Planctomycetales bacterium]